MIDAPQDGLPVPSESPVDRQAVSLASQQEVLARLTRRIRGTLAHPPKSRKPGPYLVTRTEDFWERHLPDLVSDSLTLGVARYQGLSPIGELLHRAFETFAPLLQGYIGVGAHVNNLAIATWRPTNSPLKAAKVDALVQLHARSLVLLDEVFALIYSGFPSGAEAISRTLYEVTVTAKFLHKFKAQLSERYLASHIVELWRSKSELKPRRGTAQAKHWRAFEEELDERYAAVIQEHGTSIKAPYGWASPRFAGKPGSEKKPRERIFFADIQAAVGHTQQRGRYRENSHHVHAVHLGTIKTLVHRAPETLTLGPRPYGFATVAYDALRDAQDTTEALLRSCGRSTDDKSVYYWLEALDQLSYVLSNMVVHAGSALDTVFNRDADDGNLAP
ncbi:DUF5677 domain-containing protein [Mycolicibacterium sp. YH-1]|uniref:DUF5677 domain-containing protein n=1 Tax=Mycolicibacterium sp. YH-1 TaxID=2908837 RepID=UPI001F4C0847|nr:DUF5677 domain-containing protein [Mycolicibacterium sp. YH-1]UNB50917.1 DUF5677 domain-containing protein [Mycolicibacterium sp. YH-1]